MMIFFPYRFGISYFVLFSCLGLQYRINGAVMISPSPRVVLGCVGDELEVTCTVTETTLVTWTLTIIGIPNSISRLFSATTVRHDVVTVNSTTLIFSRVSDLGASPFKSKLAVPAVSQGLNGTRITCMDRSTGAGTVSMATTTVYIYGDQGYQPQLNAPIVDFAEEEFGEERVTIHLNWTQSENSLVSYSVSVVPRNGSIVSIIDSTRANLTLSYNTPYNMTVVADICGQRNATTLIKFSYAKCEDPLEELPTHAASPMQILGYSNPALQGANISISCKSGLPLTGLNTSSIAIICLNSGQWEPNPKEVECEGTTSVVSTTVECLNAGYTSMSCSGLNYTHDQMGKPTGNPSIASIVAGSMVGLLVTIALICICVLTAILFIRSTGQMREKVHIKSLFKRRKPDFTAELLDKPMMMTMAGEAHMIQKKEKSVDAQLVYADIGPSSFKWIMSSTSTLELDDSRVEYAQLNHKILHGHHKESDSLEANSQHKGDSISIDLDRLLIQLRPHVGPKWYQFGEAAGIDREVLDNYACHCNPEDCIVEMFDYWLRNHVGPPTWKEIANLLRKIGLGELAADIDKVDLTGKLPIEVDINEIPQPQAMVLNFEVPPRIPPKTSNKNLDQLPIELSSIDVSTNKAPARPPKP